MVAAKERQLARRVNFIVADLLMERRVWEWKMQLGSGKERQYE